MTHQFEFGASTGLFKLQKQQHYKTNKLEFGIEIDEVITDTPHSPSEYCPRTTTTLWVKGIFRSFTVLPPLSVRPSAAVAVAVVDYGYGGGGCSGDRNSQ